MFVVVESSTCTGDVSIEGGVTVFSLVLKHVLEVWYVLLLIIINFFRTAVLFLGYTSGSLTAGWCSVGVILMLIGHSRIMVFVGNLSG